MDSLEDLYLTIILGEDQLEKEIKLIRDLENLMAISIFKEKINLN